MNKKMWRKDRRRLRIAIGILVAYSYYPATVHRLLRSPICLFGRQTHRRPPESRLALSSSGGCLRFFIFCLICVAHFYSLYLFRFVAQSKNLIIIEIDESSLCSKFLKYRHTDYVSAATDLESFKWPVKVSLLLPTRTL